MNGIYWFYALALSAWYCVYRLVGDRQWWQAILSPFMPLTFWLILPLLGLALLADQPFWGWVPPILLSVIVAILTIGAQIRPPKSEQPITNAGTILTLMTFNIWWSSNTRVTAQVPLTNASPRIVLLQELTPKMARIVDEELGEVYPHRVFSTGDAPKSARLGVISHYPLEAVDSSHLSRDDFRIQIVRVTLPLSPTLNPTPISTAVSLPTGSIVTKLATVNSVKKHTTLLIYNVHPRATNVMRLLRGGKSFPQRINESFSNRLAFMRMLAEDLESRNEPTIVAGDFNSTPWSDVYRLMSMQLQDTHVVAGRGFGNTFPAHHGDLKGVPVPRRSLRLDMIFCSKEIAILKSQVGKAHGESDHLPVIATLGLNTGRLNTEGLNAQ